MFKKLADFIQNRISFLNYSKRDGKGKLPIEGLVMVAVSDQTSLRFSWNLWSNFHHFVPVKVDPDEGRLTASIGFAPFAFWFSVENYALVKAIALQRTTTHGTRSEPREIRIALHDGKFWWTFWTNPDEWKSTDPWYRRGSFDFADLFFGEMSVTKEVVKGPEIVSIPMPEGSYAAKSTIECITYGRPRWFSERKTMASVTMDPREGAAFKPIPIPGKGENSYDCDEDALYSTSSMVDDDATHADAIAEVVRSVLKTRWKRGGKNWQPEAFHTTSRKRKKENDMAIELTNETKQTFGGRTLKQGQHVRAHMLVSTLNSEGFDPRDDDRICEAYVSRIENDIPCFIAVHDYPNRSLVMRQMKMRFVASANNMELWTWTWLDEPN
jgi:hypothetical protein